MRANEIIRGLLDLLDAIDGTNDHELDSESGIAVIEPQPMSLDSEINRFKQIAGILSHEPECADFANEPDEVYLNISSVTTNAGGGINGPKHPTDLRVKDPSIYPNQQEF
jgi:hypothetical protein